MNWRHYKFKLNTFAEVEARYAEVKPIVSKFHKREDDVRPVGVRNRKHERIIKVNRNKYVLTDEFWWRGMSDERLIKCAPITWTRSSEGERIRIRNTHKHIDCVRYTFLGNMLPTGLSFYTISGKQYIYCEPQVSLEDPERYLLPKSGMRFIEARALPDVDPKIHLDFKRVGPDFVNVGKVYEFVNAKHAINKKKKAAMQEGIASFWSWLLDVYDFLPVQKDPNTYDRNSFDYVQRHKSYLLKYTKEKYNKDLGQYHPYNHGYVIPPLLNDVLNDPEHPYRTHVAVLFMDSARQNIKSIDDVKSLRRKFNEFINKSGGLIKQVSEEKIIVRKESQNG